MKRAGTRLSYSVGRWNGVPIGSVGYGQELVVRTETCTSCGTAGAIVRVYKEHRVGCSLAAQLSRMTAVLLVDQPGRAQ